MNLNLSKKTKIVCTIGPASDTPEMVKKLYDAGMNVMRLNFSHGSHEEQLKKMQIARDFEKQYKIYIPVALDTKGPEMRTGLMENGKIEVSKGQVMRITKENVLGTSERWTCSFSGLYNDVTIGNHILVDDGNLTLEVIGKDEEKEEIIVKALNNHYIKDKKGMNAPMSRLSLPFISSNDEADLKFGCEQDVDCVFASFVRRPEDILDMRAVLTKYGKPDMPIFAKIENQEGVDKIEGIVAVADGVMVARGDLGDEIAPQDVPLVQRKIAQLCRKAGKPCIIATQMLESMTTHPRPTRAEVSDVATAISESADCVMLSGESASGQYPVEAVSMQTAIASAIEKELPYAELTREAFDTSEKDTNDAISNAVANTALVLGAKLIVNFTHYGNSSRRMSKSRPICPIIQVTNSRKTALKGAFMWGVYSVLLRTTMPDFTEEMEVLALKIARDVGLKPGDPIVIAGGLPTGAGVTNFLRIVNVNKVEDID